MKLHQLPTQKTQRTSARRIGRGFGSQKGGHTVGKGTKGQKSRSGGQTRPGFEGGQVPLYKQLPKYRGFTARSGKPKGINLSDLEAKFEDGASVTIKALRAAGLLRSTEQEAKILGNGEIKKKLTIKGITLSKSAEEKITKAGGKINA